MEKGEKPLASRNLGGDGPPFSAVLLAAPADVTADRTCQCGKNISYCLNHRALDNYALL